MLRRNEIRDQMGILEIGAANPESREALNIEAVLRRAREIHRQHGGIFGYDLEDWDQAWSEAPANISETKFAPARETDSSKAGKDTKEVHESCFRYAN